MDGWIWPKWGSGWVDESLLYCFLFSSLALEGLHIWKIALHFFLCLWTQEQFSYQWSNRGVVKTFANNTPTNWSHTKDLKMNCCMHVTLTQVASIYYSHSTLLLVYGMDRLLQWKTVLQHFIMDTKGGGRLHLLCPRGNWIHYTCHLSGLWTVMKWCKEWVYQQTSR